MFKFRNDTRFIEYLRASAGQYSIKIEQKVEDKSEEQAVKKWLAIGYISKSFNKEENKYIYTATDSAGNPIFQEIKELHVLKQEFRNNGKQLAQNAQIVHLAKINQLNKTETKGIPQRNSDIKKLRENKEEKQRKQQSLKQEQKARMQKTEKQMDALQTEKSKSDKENNKNTQPKASLSNDSKPENESNNQEQDRAAERMEEIQDIREQGNDLSQDIEMDM